MIRRGISLGGGARLVALMCVAEILCMAGFATYPALLPLLRAEWGLSNTAAGFVGGVLFLGYVVAVPVLTSLTDRFDARRIYLGSCLVAASGSAVFALFAHGFAGALAAQALFGIGFAGVYMPGLKAMSDRIGEELQSRATALYTSLSGFGLAGSYFLTGAVSAHASWRIAFALAAIGPVAAAGLVFLAMAPQAPKPAASRPGFFASFALVFRNKPALGYISGYVAHCWELYGSRAWMVAFLTFAAGSATGSAGKIGAPTIDAPTLASIISLGGIASSIGCNEFAKRFGRANLVTAIMATGFVFGIATGLSWQVSFAASIALLACYYATVMADSGALTAGTVAAALPEQRGATLGVHSMLGFTAGLVAPTSFGIILDLAGGAQSGRAWAASFTVLAVPNLIAIAVLRRLASRPAPAGLAPSVATRFAAPLGAQRDLSAGRRPGALGR
ncbi:MAG TPA: MFS transporter [Stellaceae bacterium]|nr:MFS transporter [Stellaceae bacterium]